MASSTLLFSASLAIPVAVVYLYVGSLLAKRRATTRDQTALQLFSIWWIALASTTLFEAAGTALAAAGVQSPGIHAGVYYTTLFLSVVALWGLMSYLAFLFTGRLAVVRTVTSAYALYLGGLLVTYTLAHPSALAVDRWGTQLVFESPPAFPLQLGLALLLFIPPMLGAGAYLWLSRRLEDPTGRYRALVVGTGILVWFGASLLASLLGVNQLAAWPLVSKGVNVTAALVILAAYQPPGWIRERGIRALGSGQPSSDA